MSYAMKPLACEPARIKGTSERLIISHYENNYGGAVKRLNAIEEVFFAGLGDGSEPGRSLKEALARDFSSYERWQSEFMAMGKALGGGSGWVLLTWSARDRKLINQWASDHCQKLAGGTPILALDMYEHSYHIDFGAKAATYVDTFMDAIRWKSADLLYDSLVKDRGAQPDNKPT
jgi:superoxide dismutase, Fe-Mn family